MELQKNSLFLKALAFVKDTYNRSTTRRAFDGLLRIWDKLVLGSVAVSWVTGKKIVLPKVTKRPSAIGAWCQEKWSMFLIFVGSVFAKDEAFSRSKLAPLVVQSGKILAERPLWCLGWLGTAFLLAYGVLRLLFVGFSLFGVLAVMFGFLFCLLLTFAKNAFWPMWTTSFFIKRLDEIDD